MMKKRIINGFKVFFINKKIYCYNNNGEQKYER
jgi:hypothetical protein